jgi:hypothetical protein
VIFWTQRISFIAFYIILGDVLFLGASSVTGVVNPIKFFSVIFSVNFSSAIKIFAYYSMSALILSMVIIDIILVFLASLEVKSMVFYPTPLYILNEEKHVEAQIRKLKAKISHQKDKDDKKEPDESFLNESHIWLNVGDKSFTNIDKKLSPKRVETPSFKKKNILSDKKPEDLKLKNRCSIDSTDLNLLDVESIIKEDFLHQSKLEE